ncbi:MAG: hypothetical protein IJJ38_00845 [Lachnospiraceae bacterium]|nr:hypothetical protein [Lachnospiraceae bacterium]
MPDIDNETLRCTEFVCPKFPKCKRALKCCALDDFFEDVMLKKEDCFDLPDKPFFLEK